MQPTIVFQPSGRRVPASSEATLWELAVAAGVELLSTCGGKGSCGKCVVIPQDTSLGPDSIRGREEQNPTGGTACLACQTRLPEGGRVWIPEQSRPERQVVLTSGIQLQLSLNSRLQSVSVQLGESSPENISPWEDRLLQAINSQGGYRLEVPLSILRALPQAASKGQGSVTVVLARNEEVVGIQSGRNGRCLGLAIDLGTTTVVALLLDLHNGEVLALASEVNPQVAQGDDVISRISYSTRGREHHRELAAVATDCVNTLIHRVCREAGVGEQEIYECLMVGNTAMHHIFLGLDAQWLARAPFAPVVSREVGIKARDLGLALAREAWVAWLPVKAGFVGADIIAVLLAVDVASLEHPTLIVDLGTNGEMVLATQNQLICCSTAAGPAFEGGHIRWGMRGAPGAVERVELDPDTLEPTLHVIGGCSPKGLCGSGLVSAVSQLVRHRVVTSSGAFDAYLQHPRLRQGEDGEEFILAFAGETAHGEDLVLTAQDVAELQMAKAAIRAGSELLCQHMELTGVDKVILAGAFGNYLDPMEAQHLGFFPEVDSKHILGAGNAAAAGALKALADSGARAQASELAQDMVYLELSSHPDFKDIYIDFMSFPEPLELI